MKDVGRSGQRINASYCGEYIVNSKKIKRYRDRLSLEGFWNNYRKGGAAYGRRPTLSEYNSALYDSLKHAGLSDKQATQAVNQAIKQQLEYNLTGDSLIPRIPGKINLPKLK